MHHLIINLSLCSDSISLADANLIFFIGFWHTCQNLNDTPTWGVWRLWRPGYLKNWDNFGWDSTVFIQSSGTSRVGYQKPSWQLDYTVYYKISACKEGKSDFEMVVYFSSVVTSFKSQKFFMKIKSWVQEYCVKGLGLTRHMQVVVNW